MNWGKESLVPIWSNSIRDTNLKSVQYLIRKSKLTRMKETMAHLPKGYTHGIKNESSNFHIYELIGSSIAQNKTKLHFKNNAQRPAAGLKTNRYDDLDLQKHIIPILGPKEDHLIVRKITEDKVGGTDSLQFIPNNFGKSHVFGVPTVRDPSGRIGKGPKRLADKTVLSIN